MADPLSSLLQKKKEDAKSAVSTRPETQASSAGKVRGLFDFDTPFSSPSSGLAAAGGSGAGIDATVGEQIFTALAPGSNVDFPMITNICERVAKKPHEVAEAVRLLVGAFSDGAGPPRRHLKAITILHELVHDQKAVQELREVPGARDALWQLQATRDSGLGPSADEQMRMFAIEVEKNVFGSFGDPFALPADPFAMPAASAPAGESSPKSPQPRQGKRTAQAMDMFSKIGSVVTANLAAAGAVAHSNLALAQEAAKARMQSTQAPEIPRLPASPDARRPVHDVQFDNVLEGEKVHHIVPKAYLVTNNPFCETPGRLLVTNYRLRFQVPKGTLRDELSWLLEKQVMDVAMGAIEELELKSRHTEAEVPEWKLRIITKDFRCLTILVPEAQELAVVEEVVSALSQPGPAYTPVLFAFRHAEALRAAGTAGGADGWGIYDPAAEFGRMGVGASSSEAGSCPWSLIGANSQYSLCDTYPAWLVEPRSVELHDLRDAAGFRKRGRLPAMSWCGGPQLGFASLWRCAQPTEGILGNPCQGDKNLVMAIRNGTTAGRDRDLLVVDLRPKKAAWGNKVGGGGGFESYEGCRLVFGNIDNVHGVRSAWRKMGQAVASVSGTEVGSWFKDVANSGWYDLIAAVLHCANLVIAEIHVHRCNAMIHCSDGWDRTAQVAALVLLCMDPHYRTLRGFFLLIQKEFCSFGHRFRTRLANGEKPSGEYSPVFLQWLECVYQLTIQFPKAFEFTSALLLLVGCEAVSNRFGTFLGDSERERVEHIAPHTLCFWAWALGLHSQEHLNSRYELCGDVLRPNPSQVNFGVWEDFWFRYRVHPRAERRQA